VSKDRKLTVTVCVGSSCHIKGARDVIMRFNELLKKQKLEDVVELKGSFCMERCGEGINWQIDDEPLTSSNVDDAVKTFKERIIKSIKSDI
jgi:NADH:ubiquinone oxidoreductase subunit E